MGATGTTPWLCTVTNCGRINDAGAERCSNALCQVKRAVWGVEWVQAGACTVGEEEESCAAALCLLQRSDPLEQAVEDLMLEAAVAPDAAAAVWDTVVWEVLDAQMRTAGLGEAVGTLMQEAMDIMDGEEA